MKTIIKTLPAIAMLSLLSACGGTDRETIVHDRPIVVSPGSADVSSDSVESTCAHGYDNSTHRCY